MHKWVTGSQQHGMASTMEWASLLAEGSVLVYYKHSLSFGEQSYFHHIAPLLYHLYQFWCLGNFSLRENTLNIQL